MRPVMCRFMVSPFEVELTPIRRALGTNIGRFVVRGLTSRHHLRENQLAAFRANSWKLRSKDNRPGNAHCTADRHSQRSAELMCQ